MLRSNPTNPTGPIRVRLFFIATKHDVIEFVHAFRAFKQSSGTAKEILRSFAQSACPSRLHDRKSMRDRAKPMSENRLERILHRRAP